PVTGGAFVDIVLDRAEQEGTGRWTVQNALDLGVPITGIAEATFARAPAASVPQRQAARGVLPAAATPWRGDGRARVRRASRPALGRVRVGRRPGRRGPDLARWLHHPRPLPQPDHRGLPARSRTAPAAGRRVLRGGGG